MSSFLRWRAVWVCMSLIHKWVLMMVWKAGLYPIWPMTNSDVITADTEMLKTHTEWKTDLTDMLEPIDRIDCYSSTMLLYSLHILCYLSKVFPMFFLFYIDIYLFMFYISLELWNMSLTCHKCDYSVLSFSCFFVKETLLFVIRVSQSCIIRIIGWIWLFSQMNSAGCLVLPLMHSYCLYYYGCRCIF